MKKTFSLALAVILLLGLAQPAAAVWAADAEVLAEETVFPGDELSGPDDPQFYSPADGLVDVNGGEHVRWIDRISVPKDVRTLYDVLEEATDHDGARDYLIDDRYFSLQDPGSDYKGEPGEFVSVRLKFSDNTTAEFTAICVTKLTSPTENERLYTQRCINNASYAFDRDHPEVFWINNTNRCYSFSSTSGGVSTYYYFYPLMWVKMDSAGRITDTYDRRKSCFSGLWSPESGIEEQIDTLQSNVGAILSGAPSGTRYDKVRYFDNWLTMHNGYNTDLDHGPWDMREATNALQGNDGPSGPVCESYALAFKVLCDRVDIPCVVVTGANHAWNFVQMEDGKWYAVDVTWDDPSGGSGKISGYENTNWLLVGAYSQIHSGKTFLEEHPAENHSFSGADGASLSNGPRLSSTAYAQIRYSGMPSAPLKGSESLRLTAGLSPTRPDEYTGRNTNRYAVTSGALPAGLSLDPGTGDITGRLQGPGDVLTQTVTVTMYENGYAAASCDVTFRWAGSYFSDVPDGAWYGGAVAWAVENDIASGTGGGKFSPDKACSRAEIVTFLWRAYDKPEPESTVSPFVDVTDPDAYYYKAVLWAVENGITGGTGGGKFSPEAPCTRAQAVTFLWRAEGEPLIFGGSAFPDVPSGAYYNGAVRWAVYKGVTNGTGDGKFAPDKTCSRSQIVTFLHRV